MKKRTVDELSDVEWEEMIIERMVEKHRAVSQISDTMTKGSDWYQTICELVELNTRYDEANGDHKKRIARGALLKLARKVGIGGAYQILIMASPISSHPIRLTARLRKRSEYYPSAWKRVDQDKKDREDEVIGLAVLREYKRQKAAGERPSIEGAIEQVADLHTVGGIMTGGSENVRRRYLSFKKLVRSRGYADSAAVMALIFTGLSSLKPPISVGDFPIPLNRTGRPRKG